MGTRSVTFDFYQVNMRSDGGRSFNKVLTTINGLPDDETRNDVMLNGHHCRLRVANRLNNIWHGEVIQIRMNDLPSKASLKGHIGPLDLEDHEGIGLGVAFMFDSSKEVLILQRNKFAVSSGAFARYVTNKGKCGPVSLVPILSADAWNRFVALREHKKLSIRVAGIDKANVFRGHNHGVADIANLAEKTEAPLIDITLSIGYSRNKRLSWNGITQLINELRDMPRKNDVLTKLTVSGNREDDQPDVINLLEEYVEATIAIEQDVELDDRRALSYEARRTALLRAWEEREQDLELMLDSSGEDRDGAQI